MRRSPAPALAVLLVVVAATGMGALPASADVPQPSLKVVSHLPLGSYRAMAVPSGEAVFIVGGRDYTEVKSDILAYNTSTGRTRICTQRLPGPRMSASIVNTGSEAIIVGGSNGPSELDTILRFSPSTMALSILPERLPLPRVGTFSAFCGGYGYIFGGNTSENVKTAEILRFDPTTENITRMNATLPFGRAGSGICAVSGEIFLFGGMSNANVPTDQILLYHPANDTLEILDRRLPYPIYHVPAVWWPNEVAPGVYLFGGCAIQGGASSQLNISVPTDKVLRFDPVTHKVEAYPFALPSPRERVSAVCVNGSVYVFGGQLATSASDEVLRISVGPAPARGLSGHLPSAVLAGIAILFVIIVATAIFLVMAWKGRRAVAYRKR